MGFHALIAADRPSDAVFTNSAFDWGLVVHLVFLKYKDDVTLDQKKEVAQRFHALQESRRQDTGQPYIKYIIGGVQNSLAGLGAGFEEGYTVGFQSAGDRNYYEGKPIVTDPNFFDKNHEDFKNFLNPLLDDVNGVLVFDYKSIYGD